ncbi:MAG: 1-(5-phosphoribosyl)-5-[(5-phosphoribosylamino)methylideneamino]imidazole-4-carboxamide isomerase [Firmicutes bacterium]|nr:1-(5-phosphoribosyl)-5-[(5-phosphoribosylamino)methylideneamino]imidazole-4-carboxamide isomerase [Bacillota bacterium]
MIILPAIDLLNKKVVRLYKGDYNISTEFSDNPQEVAANFIECGAEWLHVVDLDGAKTGESKNFDIIKSLCELKVNIECGGGIRSLETAEQFLQAGVSRVILGSKAVEDINFVKECLKNFGDKIAIGIDALNDFVKTSGWLKDSNVNYIDFAKKMHDLGVKTIIFTDISVDGTLLGASFEKLGKLQSAVKCNIIASGGIKDLNDIKNLKALDVYGAICGKSIYAKTLNLKEAIKIARGN